MTIHAITPGSGAGATWGGPAETILQDALVSRGFAIASVSPIDKPSPSSKLRSCAEGARVRFGGMDFEIYRQLGPNNMKGLAPDQFPIWCAVDAKGKRLNGYQWSQFGIPESSVHGAIAFSNWRHCHAIFALVPFGAPGIWVATIPQILDCPQDSWGKYVIDVQSCPLLDEWISDFRPFEGGHLSYSRPVQPPVQISYPLPLPRAA